MSFFSLTFKVPYKEVMKNFYIKIGIHALVWGLAFLLVGNAFAYPSEVSGFTKIWGKWRLVDIVGSLFNITLFYLIILGVEKKMLQLNQSRTLVLRVLLIWLILGIPESLIDYNLIPVYVSKYLGTYLVGLIFKYLIFTIFAFFFQFSLDRIQHIQLGKEMERQQIETELKFLKAQLSPHFLFNTLNNIYGVAIENEQDEIAEKIAKLSGLMRYMLYETNEKVIPLQKEVTCIENFIELHKLRTDDEDKLKVEFVVEGNMNNLFIPPMILIPIVENAFKYGFKTREHSPINILLKVQNEGILFECRNRIFKVNNSIKEHSGIGLANIEKRLTLIYGDHYSFERKSENGFFNLALSIKNSS